MKKLLQEYCFIFVFAQLILFAVLHFVVSTTDGLIHHLLGDGPKLSLIARLSLAAPKWLYLLPSCFLVVVIFGFYRNTSEHFYLRILGALALSSIGISVLILWNVFYPLTLPFYSIGMP
jgi:hypothetical protein